MPKGPQKKFGRQEPHIWGMRGGQITARYTVSRGILTISTPSHIHCKGPLTPNFFFDGLWPNVSQTYKALVAFI